MMARYLTVSKGAPLRGTGARASCPRRLLAGKTPALPSSGFTLIEILVASLISAMILVAVYGLFQRAIKMRDHAVERTRESGLRSRAVNVIRNDLRNAWISGSTAVLASVLEGGQTAQKSHFPGYLKFTTTTGKDTPNDMNGDVQQVEYYISDGTTNSTGNSNANATPVSGSLDAGTLVRDVTRDLLDSTQTVAREEQLLPRVASMEVTFYDGQNWLNSWELSGSSAILPEAIRVHLQQAASSANNPTPPPLDILVPWSTQTLTSGT